MARLTKQVLLIEDDLNLVGAITKLLLPQYQVASTACVDEGVALLKEVPFMAAFVDEKLPSNNGLTFIRKAKKHAPQMPVVMITAHATQTLAINCVNLGVKKFLEKPFELSEIRKTLQEIAPPAKIPISRACTLHTDLMYIEQNGKDIGLTPTEYKILEIILLADGRFVKREEITRRVWKGVSISSNALDTHLSSAKKKLGTLSERIQAYRGRGFRWEGPL